MLPVLKHTPAKRLAEETGLAVSTVKAARNGHTSPHGRNRHQLTRTAATYARVKLGEWGMEQPTDELSACASYLAQAHSRGTNSQH